MGFHTIAQMRGRSAVLESIRIREIVDSLSGSLDTNIKFVVHSSEHFVHPQWIAQWNRETSRPWAQKI